MVGGCGQWEGEQEGIHEVQGSVFLPLFHNSPTTGWGWESCKMTCARGVPTASCDISHFANTSLTRFTPFLQVDAGRGPPGAERSHTPPENPANAGEGPETAPPQKEGAGVGGPQGCS